MNKETDPSAGDLCRYIFGRNFCFSISDPKLKKILGPELSLYPPPAAGHRNILVEIDSVTAGEVEAKHLKLLGRLNTRLAEIVFYGSENEVDLIRFRLKKPVNTIHSAIQRWRSLGYNDRIERIGQIFHEQVLVPSAFFLKDIAPLHGSCMKIGDHTVMFGGSGGVGKTSLEMEFCYKRSASFVSDDMIIIDPEKTVYPNLNFPKIYAYNVSGYQDLEVTLLKGRKIADLAHWRFRSAMNLSKVRRRCSPEVLFKNVENEPLMASNYFILRRDHRDGLTIKELKREEALESSIEILRSEFNSLFGAFYQSGSMDPELILAKWAKVLGEAFKGMNCAEILIPQAMDHRQFRDKLPEFILNYLSLQKQD